jgi:hypothetical protein
MTFVILTAGIDLSIGSLVAFAGESRRGVEVGFQSVHGGAGQRQPVRAGILPLSPPSALESRAGYSGLCYHQA